MNNEKQKTILKESKTLNRNPLIDENELNNNLISYFIINDKLGTIVLARQFQAITKSELFYHATFFNQFIKNYQKEANKARSYLDNKQYRYIYFPLESLNESENLYSVLLIKKDFNIISAFNIIKLIQRMIFEILKNKIKDTNNSIDKHKGKVRLNFLILF